MSEPDQNKIPGRPQEADNTGDILNEPKKLSAPMTEASARREMSRRTRRGFLAGAVAAVLGGAGYWWLRQPQNAWVFQRIFALNEKVSQKFFSPRQRSPEFPKSAAGWRVNGAEGLSGGFDPDAWRLQVAGLTAAENFPQFSKKLSYAGTTDASAQNFSGEPVPGLALSLADIKALPRVEMTTELKCIEGWSMVVNWAGARFSDFAAKYSPQNVSPYVSLVTPDRGYYVGWDMPSILHPQTLLCYEMNGAPLNLPHGGPLRLVTTTKYGIKQIKRIGRITFTHERPKDYWNERGYDWYAGL